MLVPNMPRNLRLYCKKCDRQHWFRLFPSQYRGDCGHAIHPGTVVAMYSDSDGRLTLPSHVVREPEEQTDGG